MGTTMLLIKCFLALLTFPYQAQQAIDRVDWQAIAPPPAVAPSSEIAEPAPAPPVARNSAYDRDMIYVARFGSPEEMTALIARGGRVEATTANGESPLAIAVRRITPDGLAVVQALLAAGADVDQLDAAGETPLFHAARSGHMDAVRLLLEAGTHYYWSNQVGQIARTYAFRAGHYHIVQAMDAFVRASNQKTRAQAEAARREAEEKRRAQEAAPTPAPPKAPDRQKQLALAHSVGMSACQYQYWTYLIQAGLELDTSSEDITRKIDEYKGTNTTLSTALIRELQFPSASVAQLQQAASHSIFNLLEQMESNINRKAKGVGSDADAQTRCTAIVTQVLAPLRPPIATPATAAPPVQGP